MPKLPEIEFKECDSSKYVKSLKRQRLFCEQETVRDLLFNQEMETLKLKMMGFYYKTK
jgi:hypothetical protein